MAQSLMMKATVERFGAALAAGLVFAALILTAAPQADAAGVEYVVVDGVSIAEPLTDVPGDAARGREIFVDATLGGCGACHAVAGAEATDAARSGPSLDGVGARLSPGALRLWIVNPAVRIEAGAKPAYYSLYEPDGAPRARPRLSAQEVEDVIAYLDTLTGAAPSAARP